MLSLSKKKILKWSVIIGIIFLSCSKSFLDKKPLGLVSEESLANKRGVEGLLIGAYSLLDGIGSNLGSYGSACSNWIYGSICGSEAYKGSVFEDVPEIRPLEEFRSDPTNLMLLEKWSTIYDGVQRANDVLRILPKATDITEVEKKRIAGEAKFLRAHYHFEAKKMWNNVPYTNDSITYENQNYHVSNQKNIWPDIENDLKYAVDNLPEAQPQPGRANKYTAMGLLAKAYMFQANQSNPSKFEEAKILLDKIIKSGRYKLVNYADNFNPAKKNNEESIFSVQMSVNDGATSFTSGAYNNGNFGDVLNFPSLYLFGSEPGACCGFFQPSQYLVNHFKTLTTGLPDFDHFNDIDVTSDEGIPSDMPFKPYAGFIDPRLDWTVGRRGIPFLDWGPHPGNNWMREFHQYGPYTPKKNSYYKSQENSLTDAGFWSTGTTANNVNLIRYADVLLWAAEVEAEIGDPVKARGYVNEIRRRAADPAGWVKKPDGTPAANYHISEYTNIWTQDYARKAIRFERMLELGMEGHRFFDLVRWGIADTEINAYVSKEKNTRIHLTDVVFKKGCNEYFPIPQKEIDLSAGADGVPKMIQNCF